MKNGPYILIKAKEFPGKLYRKKFCYEHHFVYWKKTGKLLEWNEVIHHINGNRHDNKFENLQLTTRGNHNKLHPKAKIKDNFIVCCGCGKIFHKRKPHPKYPFCSRKCYKINSGKIIPSNNKQDGIA